jgi:glutathione S-transferase
MQRILYDLAGADPDFRFSPYCWRIKLALAHKNLPFETVPWRFTDKDAIAFSGQGKVPVLVDGDQTIHDSQAIAEYLETAYPNEASLFGDPPSRALTRFIKFWAEDTLHAAIVPIVLPDIFKLLDPKDQPYFRQTREAIWGITIEEMAARRDRYMPHLQAALAPLRHTLAVQPFVAGAITSFADHIAYGALKWATMTSSTPLLPADDPIIPWMRALLDTYGLTESSK